MLRPQESENHPADPSALPDTAGESPTQQHSRVFTSCLSGCVFSSFVLYQALFVCLFVWTVSFGS